MVSSRKEDKMKDIKKGDRTPAGAPSQIHKNDTLAEAILSRISRATEEDRVTRSELAKLVTGKVKDPDRAVRECISNMKQQGVCICSSPHKSGYWMADSMKALKPHSTSLRRQGELLISIADAMEESMKAFEDQVLYEKIREEYETDPESI